MKNGIIIDGVKYCAKITDSEYCQCCDCALLNRFFDCDYLCELFGNNGKLAVFEKEKELTEEEFIEVIKKVVCKTFKISIKELSDKYRHNEFIYARAVIVAILRECDYSFTRIGRVLNRNHATVINLFKTYNNLSDNDDDFREKANKVFKHIAELKQSQAPCGKCGL